MQKILTGTLRNYCGSVHVFDTEIKYRTSDYYENIGVDFEFPNFYGKFTAIENLKYFASLYSSKTIDPMFLLKQVGLQKDANKKVESYSKGMKMRLGFVRCLLHSPKLLFLDEPMSRVEYSFVVNGQELQSICTLSELVNSLEFQSALKEGTLTSIHSKEQTLEDVLSSLQDGIYNEILK